jgi:hypothetical protein
MHVIGFEPERIGIERNAADRGGAVELLAELLLGDVTNQRRCREKAQQTEQKEKDQQTYQDTPGTT